MRRPLRSSLNPSTTPILRPFGAAICAACNPSGRALPSRRWQLQPSLLRQPCEGRYEERFAASQTDRRPPISEVGLALFDALSRVFRERDLFAGAQNFGASSTVYYARQRGFRIRWRFAQFGIICSARAGQIVTEILDGQRPPQFVGHRLDFRKYGLRGASWGVNNIFVVVV